MIRYLNSYLNLDKNTYIIRYLDTDSNQIEEREFDSEDAYKQAKLNLDNLDLKLIENLLTEKSAEEVEMEDKLILRFKHILESGFKYVIMPYHELYQHSGSLIDFIFNHFHNEGVGISYANTTSLEYIISNEIFSNFGEIPLRTSLKLLRLIGRKLAEPEVGCEHFYKLFMIIFNKPNQFENSIDIPLLFNNLLGLKHEFEIKNEKVPDRLQALCNLI